MSTYNIDKFDKKILIQLMKDSRQSINIIAKNTGLTREIVSYRMQKMFENGIIKGYIARIYQPAFCQGMATLMCKLMKCENKRFSDIILFLSKYPRINWISELCGSADIVFTFLYTDSLDLANTVSEITTYLGNNLKEHMLALYISEYKFDRTGLITNKETQYDTNKTVTFIKPELTKIDDIDLEIIKILSRDCRTKNTEISKRVKISEDVVRLRINKLENNNIITGYTINMDATQLGYEGYYLGLQVENMTQHTINKIKYYVHTNPYIIFSARTSGKYNIVMTLMTKNRAHFSQVLKDIKNTFSSEISNYEFQIIMQDHKEIFVPEAMIKK